MSDKNNSVHEAGESRHILKRISSKLLIAVLVAVILPFFGLVYYIDTQIETRLKENIVGQSLSGLAGSLAGEIDAIISRRNSELIFMSSDILGDKAVEEFRVERSTMKFREPHQRKPSWGPDVLMEWTRTPQPEGRWKGESFWRRTQTEVFNRYILQRHAYDLILLIDPEGRLVTCSSVNEDNSLPEQATVSGLFDRDYSGESWFRDALAGKIVRVDKHQSALLPLAGREDIDPARRYHIGFSAPVKCFDNDRDYSGVLYTLVNWRHIQARIDVPEIKAYFSGLVKDKEPSPYAWIWGSDANTILAHKDRKLYGLKINGSRINLPQMVVDALSAHSGHYREYTFRSIKKNAAFHHCNGPNDGPLDGGFDWVVGVGIDNDDIYAMSGQLSRLLYKSTAGVMVLVILWIMLVARRTTRPILALQKHMRKVSKGNLEPHAGSDNGDDISDLADDFNHMIEDLKEKRARLIKAEKDAAWREMAAQISHDIKNTLTPITLSVDLLKQAGNDDAANYKDILKQTLEMIDSQVKNLQEIAIDFFEFTGGRKSALKECDLELMISEVLDINRAWANELGITLSEIKMPENVTIIVLADMMKLHRVLTNLVTNAFQAMPEGGALNISLAVKDNWAVLKISDNGVGIPDDVREHLFEPYFTTRSKGTGLGLAISRRVIEDIHGTITLEANKDAESGTTARICLPVFKEEAPPPKEGLY